MIDPEAASRFATANENAALSLMSLMLPAIGEWHGVAGRVFAARRDALARRRGELRDAHLGAADALRTFADTVETLNAELLLRQSQRNDASDAVGRIDRVLSYTTDPAQVQRLRNERSDVQHDLRRADCAITAANEAVEAAERTCAGELSPLADLREMEPLAERLAELSLEDFLAYKGLVTTNVVPGEGLNWTADGCSDYGIVTGSVDLGACQLHDFGYRNEDQTRDPWWLDKIGRAHV